jgi:hypothetical protein
VLTVSNAKESCPGYSGTAIRLHQSFKDPAVVEESQEGRTVRDEIRFYLKGFPQQ